MPPSASSNRPFLPRMGAGECAFLVAKQFGFDQRIGKRRATDLDERLLAPRRIVMKRVRDQFLAGARLSADQHGRIGVRDLDDLLVDLFHRARGADDVCELVAFLEFTAKVRVLVQETLSFVIEEVIRL